MRSGRIRVTVFIPTLVSCVIASHALAQYSYFQNKTIKIIRGGEPGARETCRRECSSILEKAHTRRSAPNLKNSMTLPGEQVEVAIRELPRDREVVSLYKKNGGAWSAAES
jgi:hypothetical protein